MYTLQYSNKFKKSLKKIKRNSNFKIEELEHILFLLANNTVLDKKYNNHKLQGEFENCFECHVRPNILLVYRTDKDKKIVYVYRIGSHSDLF